MRFPLARMRMFADVQMFRYLLLTILWVLKTESNRSASTVWIESDKKCYDKSKMIINAAFLLT